MIIGLAMITIVKKKSFSFIMIIVKKKNLSYISAPRIFNRQFHLWTLVGCSIRILEQQLNQLSRQISEEPQAIEQISSMINPEDPQSLYSQIFKVVRLLLDSRVEPLPQDLENTIQQPLIDITEGEDENAVTNGPWEDAPLREQIACNFARFENSLQSLSRQPVEAFDGILNENYFQSNPEDNIWDYFIEDELHSNIPVFIGFFTDNIPVQEIVSLSGFVLQSNSILTVMQNNGIPFEICMSQHFIDLQFYILNQLESKIILENQEQVTLLLSPIVDYISANPDYSPYLVDISSNVVNVGKIIETETYLALDFPERSVLDPRTNQMVIKEANRYPLSYSPLLKPFRSTILNWDDVDHDGPFIFGDMIV